MAGTAMTVIREIPQRIAAFSRKALSVLLERPPFYPISMIRAGLTPVDTNRGLMANVVMACVFWIQRAFTEAELVVQRRKPDGMWERVLDHPLEMLIANPNDFYDSDALWKATVLSYVMDGNAYWWKIRNQFTEVIELWYIPHWMIRPVGRLDGESRPFIDGYQITMGIRPPLLLSPNDVVHFRFGLDPEDTRMGMSPLRSVMREIEADMQAAAFSDTVLQNMGVPGLILSPKDSASVPTPDQLAELRTYLKSAVAGGNFAANLVFGRPTDVVQLGFDPNKVNLAGTRDVSEERVCAIIGIPAAVVGFGAGLQSTKVGATMRELVKLAQVQCISPMQTTMSRQVTAQLMPDFVAQTRRFRARFDSTEASSFQEEFDLRVSSVMRMVEKGALRVDRAQEMLGLEVDPTMDVYLIPVATPITDPTEPDDSDTPESSTPSAPEPAAEELPEDVVKMLEGIRARHGTTNGTNGRHRGTHRNGSR